MLKNNMIGKKGIHKAKRCKFAPDKMELLLMCAPASIIILLISYLPMAGLVVAFQRFNYSNGFFRSEWVGFKNFKYLFIGGQAWRITRNTIGLNILFIVAGLVVSLIFALMLYEITNRNCLKVYQTVMFFPYFISWVVAAYVVYAFLKMDGGLVNTLLAKFNIPAVQWYSEAKYWPVVLLISYLWKWTGYYCIIYYTGLMGIDSEYYEAADIDGASKLQKIFHISLPLLTPLIIVMVLLQIGRIFYADFGMFYNLPMNSGMLYETTDVIDTYVFRSFRITGEIGMASAAGFYQSIVGLLMVMASNFIVKRINPENALY